MMPSLRPAPLRSLVCATLFVSPACVLPLSDRNEPEENGGVTGAPARCTEIEVLPRGAPAGDATPVRIGRFAFADGQPETPLFDWSGTSIRVRFQGTTRVTVKLRLVGDVPQDQLFTFAVDTLPPVTRQITVKTDAAGRPTLEPEENYDIAGLDPSVPHELTVYKNTEAQKGPVMFKGFELHGGTRLSPTRRARRMEVIGDSIVCGYGNEGTHATCPFELPVRAARDANGEPIRDANGNPVVVTVPFTENQYRSFTAIAARELDADAVTLCWSGKGVYKNYKERLVRDPVTRQLVPDQDALATAPELWERRTLGSDPRGFPWDFSREPPEELPHVVVIGLGTNDFVRDTLPRSTDPAKLSGDNIPDGDLREPAERERFYETYLAFVRKVRERRPDAHIFLATSPMVSDRFPFDGARAMLRDALERVVVARSREGDARVYRLDLVDQGSRYGLGCDYHPNLEVHRIMARQLVGAVRSKTCW